MTEKQRKSEAKKKFQKKLKARDYRLRKTYGITSEDYERMLDGQGGGCFICGNKPKEGRYLQVDHNHKTGFVRGLLCYYCNRYYVRKMDNKMRVEGLIKYLQKALKEDKEWV